MATQVEPKWSLGHRTKVSRHGGSGLCHRFVPIAGFGGMVGRLGAFDRRVDPKQINDRDGHAAGDHVLKTLVWTMREKLRPFSAPGGVPIAKAGDKLTLGFKARDVYLVMSAPGSVTAHVTIGVAATTSAAGTEDVSASGEITVSSSRLYHLVHPPSSEQATVTVTFDASGAQAFAFTVGS
jgi:hypothetical protein